MWHSEKMTLRINNTLHNNTLPLSSVSLNEVSSFIYFYSERHYAECRHAECCYSECCGAYIESSVEIKSMLMTLLHIGFLIFPSIYKILFALHINNSSLWHWVDKPTPNNQGHVGLYVYTLGIVCLPSLRILISMFKNIFWFKMWRKDTKHN